MKKFFIYILAFFATFFAFVEISFANDTAVGSAEGGIISNNPSKDIIRNNEVNSILGISDQDLRSGNIDMDSIPLMIVNLIQFVMAIAGTISVFMLIFFAFKMQLASGITGESHGVENAKKGMIAAGVWFVISISAWFIIARVIDILSITT